jgi:glutamate-1-semialdehyde 2,1-aminomutase
MKMTWELRDYDLEFFNRELDSFVPDTIFDAHAHLYELGHWKVRTALAAGPDKATLEVFQEQIQWITPGRETHGLFFGGGLYEGTYRASNEFLAREAAKDPKSRGQLIVSPRQDPEEVRQEVRRLSMVGLKVYHLFVEDRPSSHDSEIEEFLTEDHVRIAHEEGLSVTLHMVKPRALADPGNQARIRYYCESYPNLRLILAHAGRSFNPHHTIEGIHSLEGIPNVWFDTSAVTEAGAFEAIVDTFGHERLLWGSDYPISHFRGRCVGIGDQFLWLYEDTLDWKRISHVEIQPYLVGMESLRAVKLAATRLRLTDTQVEDVFCNNGRKLFDLD